MRLLPIRRLFGANRRGLVKGPATVDGTKHLLDDGTWTAVTATGIAASEAEALAGTNTTKFISPATGNARALQGDMTRKISDVLFSDGATSNRRLEATPGSPGAIAGMPATFWVKRFFVPTSTIGGGLAGHIALAGTGTTNPTIQAYSFSIFIYGDYLRIRQTGATHSVDFRQLEHSTFRTTYSGQWVQLVISFATGDSTTAPTIWCDGVDITSSFTASTAGTAPNWMPTTLDATKFLNGIYWPAGPIPEVEYGLGAWTAAEALTAAQTGLPPPWWQVGTGSAVNTVTGDSATFTSGLGSWVNDSSSLVSLSVVAGKMLAVFPASGNAQAGAYPLFPSKVGAKYRLSLKARLSAGTAKQLYFGNNGGVAGSYFNFTPTGVEAEYSGEITVPSGATLTLRIGMFGSNSSEYEFDDISIIPLGPLAKWEIQPVAWTCADSGDNGIPLLLTSGITAVGDKPDHITLRGNPMTADGFILADQVVTPTGYELVSAYALQTGTATSTITVKETSSGGTTVATGALSASVARVALTVSNGLLAGAKKLHLANPSWGGNTVTPFFVFRRAG